MLQSCYITIQLVNPNCVRSRRKNYDNRFAIVTHIFTQRQQQIVIIMLYFQVNNTRHHMFKKISNSKLTFDTNTMIKTQSCTPLCLESVRLLVKTKFYVQFFSTTFLQCHLGKKLSKKIHAYYGNKRKMVSTLLYLVKLIVETNKCSATWSKRLLLIMKIVEFH
jgi:hypothetical protein